MNKLWAVGFSALLVLSILTMMPKVAMAQTAPIGTVENWVEANFANGSHCIFSVSENLPTATLTGSGCGNTAADITSFDFLVLVLLPSNQPLVVTDSSIGANVAVMGHDGIFHAVSVTGGHVSPPIKTTIGFTNYFTVYNAHADAATVEAAIGAPATTDTSNIQLHVASSIGFVTVHNTSTGANTQYAASSQTSTYFITQKAATGGGGCVGTSCPTAPTGRIYPVVTVHYVDGSTSIQTPGPSFNLASFVLLSDTVPKNVTSINWELRLFVDNDVYVLPQAYNGFLDPASTSNFGAQVNGHDVLKQGGWNYLINRIASTPPGATYHLLDMNIQGTDIEQQLTTITTGGGVKYTQGTLTFSVAPATLLFRTSTNNYPISVQSWLTQEQMLGQELIGGGGTTGPCDINNLTCQLNTAVQNFITQVATALHLTDEQAEIVIGVVVLLLIILVVGLAKAKKKGNKAINWRAL